MINIYILILIAQRLIENLFLPEQYILPLDCLPLQHVCHFVPAQAQEIRVHNLVFLLLNPGRTRKRRKGCVARDQDEVVDGCTRTSLSLWLDGRRSTTLDLGDEWVSFIRSECLRDVIVSSLIPLFQRLQLWWVDQHIFYVSVFVSMRISDLDVGFVQLQIVVVGHRRFYL